MGFSNFLKCTIRLGIEAFILMLIITFIPGLPPYVKITEPYKITKASPEGKFAYNNKLDSVEFLFKNEIHGPESLALDDNGVLYTTLRTGEVVKLVGKDLIGVAKFGKKCENHYDEKTCGRPLGLRFDKDGFLYVADAYYGIFKVNPKTGENKNLVSIGENIGGQEVTFPNSVAIACNGDIYWTDSSTQFDLQDGIYSVLADPTGRLIHYDSKTGKNKILLDKIHFANGVMLSKNQDFLLLAETVRNRIHRFYLKGQKAGTSDIFIDGLPGFPDNIQSDGKSGFFITTVSESNSKHPNMVHIFSQFPNVRKFGARVLSLIELGFKTIDNYYPNEFSKKALHFVGHLEPISLSLGGRTSILHISENGEILDIVWSSNKTVGQFCEALVVKDQLYLASPFNKYLGRIPLSKIGWEHLKTDPTNPAKKICQNINEKMGSHQAKPKLEEKPTTTTPKPTTTTPKPTTTTPKPTTTTPQPTTTTPKPTTTTTPKPTTTPPNTAAPKATQTPTKVKEEPKPKQVPSKPAQNEPVKKSPPPTEKPKIVESKKKPESSESTTQSKTKPDTVKKPQKNEL